MYMCVCTYTPSFLRAAVPNTRPPAVARRPGPKAAHTAPNVVTPAVFHAPMFALNADAEANACAPSHPRSTPTGRRSHVSARMRARPISHAHARAHGRNRGACAHAHAYLSQQYTHTYMYKIYICVYNVI